MSSYDRAHSEVSILVWMMESSEISYQEAHPIWEEALDAASKHDKAIIDGWKDELANLLIFVRATTFPGSKLNLTTRRRLAFSPAS